MYLSRLVVNTWGCKFGKENRTSKEQKEREVYEYNGSVYYQATSMMEET